MIENHTFVTEFSPLPSRLGKATVARGLLLAIIGLFLSAGSIDAREKIDVITLMNGDRITCEVRQLELGKLTIKTDAMGTLVIEWPEVERIESVQLFEVENTDGQKYYGSIAAADDQGYFTVTTASGEEIALALDRIVRITAMDESWHDRWRGYLDFGYTYISASSSTQVQIDAQATYRTRKFLVRGVVASLTSGHEAEDSDGSDDFEWSSWSLSRLDYEWFLRNRWFLTGFGSWEHDDSVGLDQRTTAGAGLGRYLVQSNRSLLSVLAGVTGNRETYTEVDEDQSEVEDSEWNITGLLSIRQEFFIFGGHDTSLSTELSVRPSVSNSGRYRINFDTTLRRELIADFTVSLSVTSNYDSDPPVEGTDHSSHRIVSKLGWSFEPALSLS